MSKSLRDLFKAGYASLDTEMRSPNPLRTNADAREYALAAHNKALHYLAKAQELDLEVHRLAKENDRLKGTIETDRASFAKTAAGAARFRERTLLFRVSELAARVIEIAWSAEFIDDAIRPGSKIDYLMRKYGLSRKLAVDARNLLRLLVDVEVLNAQNQHGPARIQQGDRIGARTRAH